MGFPGMTRVGFRDGMGTAFCFLFKTLASGVAQLLKSGHMGKRQQRCPQLRFKGRPTIQNPSSHTLFSPTTTHKTASPSVKRLLTALSLPVQPEMVFSICTHSLTSSSRIIPSGSHRRSWPPKQKFLFILSTFSLFYLPSPPPFSFLILNIKMFLFFFFARKIIDFTKSEQIISKREPKPECISPGSQVTLGIIVLPVARGGRSGVKILLSRETFSSPMVKIRREVQKGEHICIPMAHSC